MAEDRSRRGPIRATDTRRTAHRVRSGQPFLVRTIDEWKRLFIGVERQDPDVSPRTIRIDQQEPAIA
jgi:hypothetical protein